MDYVRVYSAESGQESSPPRSAEVRIEAEDLDQSRGLLLEETGDEGNGQNVGWIADGDYGLYSRVDFGENAPAEVKVRWASGADIPGWVEFRIDSLAGMKVAQVEFSGTGGWQTWQTQTNSMVASVTGRHDLYLVFRSDYGETEFVNINWFEFVMARDSSDSGTVSGEDDDSGTASPPDPPSGGDAFSYVVIPDTQFMTIWYNGSRPEMFESQTDWIVRNASQLNTLFVSHLGDIVETGSAHDQWQIANEAMSLLDGHVPYGLTFGNHDADDGVWGRSDSVFNQYFPVSRYEERTWYGGSYPLDKNTNSYQFFENGDDEYMVVHLQWDPPVDVLTWLDQLLGTYPDKRTIVSTHEFPGSWVLWNQVLRHHAQVFLVVSGHECARERANVLTNEAGGQVHAILTDYQCDNPARGLLRYYTFLPSGTVEAHTYSPWDGSFEEDADSSFSFVPNYGRGTATCSDSGPTPYPGSPTPIPGRIEAEDYDSGCNGVAFWDMDVTNQGGAYRSDAVDIEEAEDGGGGFNVGWLRDGEWLGYTVEVEEAGVYDLAFRVASNGDGSTFRLEWDGIGLGEPVEISPTGGWQSWETVSIEGVSLAAGSHIMRLVVVDGDFNINFFDVTDSD
ncbi:MAG: carbohydrate-binding protein [Myxococcota bacterium]|nr:carbohydrate-binding protein [Myxococcota bacterium]